MYMGASSTGASGAHNLNISQHVAGEIRAAMARKRVTQRELADGTGISRVSLSERLSGRRPFNTDQIFLVATYLCIDVWTLFPTRAQEAEAESA